MDSRVCPSRIGKGPLPLDRIENIILEMQNKVLSTIPHATPVRVEGGRGSRVNQVVDRGLEARRTAAREEIERLVAATLKLIERTGRLDPKVSDILTEAGLSNQAFYRHFRGKHELLVAVLDEGIRGLADYLTRRMSAAKTPTDSIREWIRGMAAQAQNPGGAQATRPFALARGRLAESFGAEVTHSEAQMTAPLRGALEAAVVSGDLPQVHPSGDAEMLYLLMMNWVEARLIEGRIPEEGEVARLESFALAGLARGSVLQADQATP
jgi:AcrR family transcriptional regulator